MVVFSQVRIPGGKFGLERLFARSRHSCLYLNDTRGRWYLGQDAAIDRLINDACESLQPARRIYYGSSMGGFGALSTALRRGDGMAHAFGTELELGRPGSRSLAAGVAERGHLHSLAQSSQADLSKIHLYFGCLDPVDAGNAARAEAFLPKAHRHLLTSSHASHDHLYSLNLIRRIIMTFERDPAAELASKNLYYPADPTALPQFCALFEALIAQHRSPLSDIESLPGFNINPGMQRLAAEVVAKSGEYQEARRRLEETEALVRSDAVLSGLPKRWRKKLPLRRVELLIEEGNLSGAANLLQQTASEFPIDARMKTLSDHLGGNLPEAAKD